MLLLPTDVPVTTIIKVNGVVVNDVISVDTMFSQVEFLARDDDGGSMCIGDELTTEILVGCITIEIPECEYGSV